MQQNAQNVTLQRHLNKLAPHLIQPSKPDYDGICKLKITEWESTQLQYFSRISIRFFSGVSIHFFFGTSNKAHSSRTRIKK